MTIRTYTPIDPAPLARMLVVLLWIDLAAAVLSIPVTLAHLGALAALDPATPTGFWNSIPEMEAADNLVLLGLAPQLVALVLAGFLSLKWVYRVSRNAHAMASGLSVRPPWAVGWFFVPLANLLMPFRGVREAWQASTQPEAWRNVAVPGLLRLWWGLWLVFAVLDNASFRVELRASSVSGLIAADYLTLAASLLRVPLDLAFMRVVRQLTDRQVTALHQHTFA